MPALGEYASLDYMELHIVVIIIVPALQEYE